MRLIVVSATAVLALASFGARAQTVPNGGIPGLGIIWTVQQWNTAWQSKVDVASGSLSSPTITGGTISAATITGGSLDNAPIGSTTPSSGAFSILSTTGEANLLQQTLIGGAAGASWTTTGTSGATSEGLYEHIITASGTMTDSGWSPLNSMIVGHDSRVNTSGISNLLYLDLQLGPQSQGTKHAFDVEIFANTLTADKANSRPSPFFNAFRADVWGTVNEGGTGTSATTSYGDLFGGNTEATMTGAATDWHGVTSFEADVSVCAACSVASKIGINVVLSANDTTNGALFDAGYALAAQNGVSDGWQTGLALGNPMHQWPIAAAGTLIQASRGANDTTNPATAAWGIDMRQATFSGGLLRGVNFSISGLGNVVVGPGEIVPTSSGLSISAPGEYVSATAVSAGGTGYTVTGGVVRDDYGDEWTISTVNGGAVTGLTLSDAGYEVGGSPSNPVPTYCVSGNCGNGDLTINLTWSATGNIGIGAGSVATTAASGFPVLPTSAGSPTGSAPAGSIEVDTADSKVCVSISSGTWHCI